MSVQCEFTVVTIVFCTNLITYWNRNAWSCGNVNCHFSRFTRLTGSPVLRRSAWDGDHGNPMGWKLMLQGSRWGGKWKQMLHDSCAGGTNLCECSWTFVTYLQPEICFLLLKDVLLWFCWYGYFSNIYANTDILLIINRFPAMFCRLFRYFLSIGCNTSRDGMGMETNILRG